MNCSNGNTRFQKTHGLSGSPEYAIWRGMIARCRNPRSRKYHDYGAKGIDVSEEWLSFPKFFADIGARPSPDHSIDRKDGSRGYGPNNCRWATHREQQRNLKSNRILTFRGEKKCLTEWAEIAGLPMQTVWKRIEAGWSVEDALSKPKGNTGPKPKT